jgi:hypothetical protein
MDSKPVHMLSTFQPSKAPVLINSKDNTGSYVEITVDRPTNIAVYNEAMGGTDLFDQFNAYLRSTLRTKAWQFRIYSHFLLSSAINASILKNFSASVKVGKLASVMELIEQWSGEALGIVDELDNASEASISDPNDGLDLSKGGKMSYSRHVANFEFRSAGCHYPHKSSVLHEGTEQRGYCVVCNKRTTTSCAICSVSMCINGTGSQNCYFRFHTMRKFKD